MSIELRVPQLPESVSDATILSWHKQPGESVTQDETLVDLETDKVVLEVPAPQDGVLKEIRFKVGETVQAEDVLALMEAGKAAASPAAASSMPVESAAAAADEAPVLSPAVRRLVKESGIDPATIKGSGKNGRIVKADVEAAIAAQPTQTAAQPATPTAQAASEGRIEERVPMTRLRKRVAERLVEAQHTAAILTTFNEVNLQAVSNLRVTYRESFEK
ncbi:MAG: biotin/lipoyl-containing protein, partial [Candidatus Thiodiazotropha lotti]